MNSNKQQFKHEISSKIIGIQFSLLSPEEIRKGSVAEITSKESYVNNKPVINGLFDPRMGVLEPGLICPTDGLDHFKTPGYFGHIELVKPVFYIQYFDVIRKILRCVCFKCSKLLISKQKYKQALTMPNGMRWKYVSELCKNVKRCGDSCEDGCECVQPSKIKKDGIATIVAEWPGGNLGGDKDDKVTIQMTPELVLKIFKRISNEDVTFMGFSPMWSRPDWMICQVLAVPPPSVRPSVKHDAQQRSEDDLTHILVNVIKANRTLMDKIKNNAPDKVVADCTMLLQFHVATLVDNNIQGGSPIRHRSGRPYKSLKDRLGTKHGRMRNNLMAKRVDFSARSVITADPNISIRELGIPLRIAKNITKPVRVNKLNKRFLLKLVQNGPEVWPGAKVLERKNGQHISLRYLDRQNLILEEGDIVHRHMMDGDPILFNRQPTLHRMSMMCHIAKIMKQGDTFRMNVADTKPYNADFDGDEMNLHMPQDPEAESELRQLAAVPYQIISPGNNAPIIGIYQDSMLGSYQFTRPHVRFTLMKAMNLLMMFQRVNMKRFRVDQTGQVSNFEILSQIMPPFTITMENNRFKNTKIEEDKDRKTSNHIVEIINGQYLRGQMDKGVLGSGTRGLIHRTCNDFGNMAASQFIDDLQNIVTEYMKQSAFSVGISDLIVSQATADKIVGIITTKKNDVKKLIDQVQFGIFENTSGKTNAEEFESQVSNYLGTAQKDAGSAAIDELGEHNRFTIMLNSGSKGSDVNIQQMAACLGQQTIDNKRIPYGFEHRTLPHFSQFDDTAIARGFVESNFLNGLSPQELFFHAMGGRIGLIDTAVKTSTTGYIQRRLIKGLEDLMVSYDMTVRSSKNKIVQFRYGDDGIDPIKVENQDLRLVDMSIQDIYAHYAIVDVAQVRHVFLPAVYSAIRQSAEMDRWQAKCIECIDLLCRQRDRIIHKVFDDKTGRVVRVPVAFAACIQNVIGQQGINANSLVDLTLMEAMTMMEETYARLELLVYAKPTLMFKTLYLFFLSPKDLLIHKRFNRKALTVLLETIVLMYKRAIVTPGEMVGMVAAQSIGGPTTQMTLNTFHFAGVASKSNVTRGVPRMEEILTLTSEMKSPSLTIYLKPEEQTNKEMAGMIQYRIERTTLLDVVKHVEICFDPDQMATLIEQDRVLMSQYKDFEDMISRAGATLTNGSAPDLQAQGQINVADEEQSKWIIRMEIDPEILLEKNITMDDVHFALENAYQDLISCVYSDYNADQLLFRIRMKNAKTSKKAAKALDQTDQIYQLKMLQEQLLNQVVLRGVTGIQKVVVRKMVQQLVETAGMYHKEDIWVLDTVGTNLLDVLGLSYIDRNRTMSNDIHEIFHVLGMEAARQAIFNELSEVLEFDGDYVNAHHMTLLCDRMTNTHKLTSIFRHGINADDIGPIAKASFEETTEMFLNAARHAELDTMRGISANIMCGQEGLYGTAAFQVVLDINQMSILAASDPEPELDPDQDPDQDQGADQGCSQSDLLIANHVTHIETQDMGQLNDEYQLF